MADEVLKRLTTYIQVAFGEAEIEDDETAAESQSLSLDCISDQPVPLGNTAYFRLLGTITGDGITLSSSIGTASFDEFGVSEEVVDDITFANESEQQLSRVPVFGSTVTIRWIGTSPGNVIIDGDLIKTSGGEKISGILVATYDSLYTKVKLTGVNDEPDGITEGESFDVLVTAVRAEDGTEENPDETASATCSFQAPEDEDEDDDGDGDEEDADITEHEDEELSLDCISDEPVPLGETGYFRLLGTSTVYGLTFTSTVGETSVFQIGVTEEIIDDITFENSSEEELSRIPISGSTFNYFWIGRSPGNVIFNGKKVTSSGGTLLNGILRVTYISSYIKVQLTGVEDEPIGIEEGEEFDVLVTAFKNGISASATCSFQVAEDEVEELPKDVEITVCDYCSGDVVEGASVYLTRDTIEELVGLTNAAGTILLEQVTSGMGIRIDHPEYIPSDEDNLSNDTLPDLSEIV